MALGLAADALVSSAARKTPGRVELGRASVVEFSLRPGQQAAGVATLLGSNPASAHALRLVGLGLSLGPGEVRLEIGCRTWPRPLWPCPSMAKYARPMRDELSQQGKIATSK